MIIEYKIDKIMSFLVDLYLFCNIIYDILLIFYIFLKKDKRYYKNELFIEFHSCMILSIFLTIFIELNYHKMIKIFMIVILLLTNTFIQNINPYLHCISDNKKILKIYIKDNLKSNINDKLCVICYCYDKCIKLQCGHYYHIDCIKDWIYIKLENRQHPNCPICKINL